MNKREGIIAGNKYGKLTAIEDTGNLKNRAHVWLFRCDCGDECYRVGGSVKIERIQNCGNPSCRLPHNKLSERNKIANVANGDNAGSRCYLGRRKLRLSVSDFAKLCGLSTVTISEIESGRSRRIYKDTTKKLNSVLSEEYNISSEKQ